MLTRYLGVFCGACEKFNPIQSFSLADRKSRPDFDFTIPDPFKCEHCSYVAKYSRGVVMHCSTLSGDDPIYFQQKVKLHLRPVGELVREESRTVNKYEVEPSREHKRVFLIGFNVGLPSEYWQIAGRSSNYPKPEEALSVLQKEADVGLWV